MGIPSKKERNSAMKLPNPLKKHTCFNSLQFLETYESFMVHFYKNQARTQKNASSEIIQIKAAI